MTNERRNVELEIIINRWNHSERIPCFRIEKETGYANGNPEEFLATFEKSIERDFREHQQAYNLCLDPSCLQIIDDLSIIGSVVPVMCDIFQRCNIKYLEAKYTNPVEKTK